MDKNMPNNLVALSSGALVEETSVLNANNLTLEIAISPEFASQYAALVKAKDTLSKIDTAIKDKLKDLMRPEYLHTGENKVETDKYVATFVAGYVKTSFDEKKFKEENPELWEKYHNKTSVTSDSVRIKVKED